MADSVPVRGFVAAGFEAVREEFVANLAERGDGGAAFAMVHNGQTVVDLWGGLADAEARRPWEEDTTQVIFSGSKALVALCLLILADRGELDLTAPVARYWPEFAAQGKDAIRVCELASHQARLPGIRSPMTYEDLLDDRSAAALLAAQPPEQDPRAADAYHPLTYGWLCGEVIRRVDGRSIGQFFADEVARPLDLRLWIGLPPEQENAVATLRYAPTWRHRLAAADGATEADDLMDRVWNNPPLFPPNELPFNRPDWHQAEIPGVGAIGTARSLARLYGCLAQNGETDDIRLLSRRTLHDGCTQLTRRRDPLIDELMAFGTGFRLQTESHEFGPVTEAFGHPGAGGSVSCAWPSHHAGLAYATNVLRDDQPVDIRAQALLSAAYRSISSRAT